MISDATEAARPGRLAATLDLAAARAPARARSVAWAAAPAAVLLGCGFFALTAWMAFVRHDTFNTGRFDLEIYAQVVWNTGHGRPFETTLLKTNLNHLAEHLAFVLIPISWLYRVVPDPKLLLAVQQLALALLGWPIFLWARRALGSPGQALLVLACFYATPALAGIAFDDFHAVPIATLPLAFGFWLVLAGRPRLGAAVALLALPMEEESALFVAGLGAFLFVRRERPLGTVVGGLGALWLATAAFVVMPGFHDSRTLEEIGGNRTLGHFAELRADPAEAIVRIAGERGLNAATWLVLPTAGLGLLAPRTLLVSGPHLAALLLQDRDDTFGRHWAAPLLVGIWMGTIAGLARLRPGRGRRLGLGLLVVGTAFGFWLASPLPGGGRFDAAALESDERTDLLARAVARVPPDGTVVASASVVAHLANRPEAYVFPIDSHYAEELGWRKKRPDFYVLDLYDDLTNRATASDRLNPLEADRPYHIWSAGRKVLVLMDQPPEPAIPLEARYGDRLLLRGYDRLQTPDGTRLVLHWERYGPLRGRYDRDLTIFDASGARLLYEEDMALSSLYGSNKWQPGQRILDEITLPRGVGPLRLRIAWVAQDKRSPFLLADGSEAFELTVDPAR
jgi:uncharacterized membrane protein